MRQVIFVGFLLLVLALFFSMLMDWLNQRQKMKAVDNEQKPAR